MRGYLAWEADYKTAEFPLAMDQPEIAIYQLLRKHYSHYIYRFTGRSKGDKRSGLTTFRKTYVKYNTKEGYSQFVWNDQAFTIPDFCIVRWLVEGEVVNFTSTDKYYSSIF